MRRALVVVLVLVAACGSKKKQKRTGDAAPVVVVPTPVFDGSAPATAIAEVEPNDSADLATVVALGATARGEINSETDVDYFRIEVGQAGALAVLTNLADIDLAVDIEDATGAVLARSDRGGNRVREGVPNLGVAPGKYIAVVRRKPPPPPKKTRPKKGQAPPAPPPFAPVSYEITATLATPAAGVEREPDDDRGTANDLIPGEAVQGFIGWANDIDLWKLSVELLSTKNVIHLEVGAVDGVALAVEVADGIGNPILVRRAPRNAPLVVKNLAPVVASGAPPFHYVTVKGDKDRSNPETPYTLRVTPGNIEVDMELEPNDTLEKPMAFDPERTRVEGVWTTGDVDCYAIAADVNPRTLDILLEPQDADLSLELLVDGKVVAKSETAGKDTSEKLLAAVPASAKAIVRVRPAKADATGEGTYVLAVREGAAAGP